MRAALVQGAVAVAVVAVVLGCGRCGGSVVATPAGIEDCATRETYCVRVSCRVRNDGSTRESAMVRLEIPIPGDEHYLSEHQTLSLGPSEATIVRAEFTMGKSEPGFDSTSFAEMGTDCACSVL